MWKIAKQSIFQNESPESIGLNVRGSEPFPTIKFLNDNDTIFEMKKDRPDNIVFSEDNGYNAALLPYGTNVGAPVIRVDDVVSWKKQKR